MKLNIKKFASGGASYYSSVVNPFSAAAIEDRTLTAISTDSSKSSGSEGVVSKEVMNALMKTGIPSDVELFMQDLYEFESQSDFGLGVNKSKLYSLKAKANRIILAADYLKTAETEATKNGALDEIAVDGRGYFYTIGEDGKINKTHMSKYNPKERLALTVSELLEQRKYSPQLADSSDVAATIGTNIGTEKINDYIRGIIQTIGDSTTSLEAYTDLAGLIGKEGAKRPTEAQFKALLGIATLWEKLGPDAIFKNKELMSSKNIKDAMSYIINMLPQNMLNQLKGRYIAELGGDYKDAGKYSMAVIETALNMGNKTKDEYSIDYESSLHKVTNPTKSGGSSKTFYQTPLEAFFDGDLNQTDIVLTDNSARNQHAVVMKGVTMPALTTDNRDALNNLPMSIAMSANGSGVLKYLDTSHVYMGDEKVTEGKLLNIAYTNAKVAIVDMPVREDGSVDWTGFHACSQAEDKIKSEGITDIAKKNQIHQELGSYILYTPNGERVPIYPNRTAQYLMTNGYTIDDQIGPNNTMAKELTGNEEDQISDVIDSIYNKEMKKKYGIDGIDSRNSWDDIIAVPVFIKVNSETASQDAYRYGGHGSNMTPRTLQEDMTQQLLNREPQMQIQGSGSLLYQE